MRTIETGNELLEELRRWNRDVYLSQAGTWHLTQTRDLRIAGDAVTDLRCRGVLARTYSDCTDCFSMGKGTIDVAATLEARKREGKRAPLVYVETQK